MIRSIIFRDSNGVDWKIHPNTKETYWVHPENLSPKEYTSVPGYNNTHEECLNFMVKNTIRSDLEYQSASRGLKIKFRENLEMVYSQTLKSIMW